MYAAIARGSKIEGKDENRTVTVDRVTVRSLSDAKRQRVVLAETQVEGGVRVTTVDGKKLTFDTNGALVAGGVEEAAKPKAAAADDAKKDDGKKD